MIIKYHGCQGEAMQLIPYYLIDIIYKTVKPSYLKKLQVIQNTKNLIFQVIVSFTPYCCWRKQIFDGILPGGMSNSLLPKA